MMAYPEDDLLLQADRDDLLALLTMRFGSVPAEVGREIGRIGRSDRLQRLILVAANAKTWTVFAEELRSGDEAFKLVGERFQPAAGQGGGRDE